LGIYLFIGGFMSEEKKPESVWVQPTKGKYCELQFGDALYKVWKVNPGSEERFGTQIPYDVAVYFLGKVPPVITLVPEIKGGKHTSPLLPEDVEKIRESLSHGFVGGIKNYNDVSRAAVPGEPGTDSGSVEALKQALDLLAQQTAANKSLQESLVRLQGQVDKLEQKSAGSGPVKPVTTPSSPPASPPSPPAA
jgi:hypothetical protein